MPLDLLKRAEKGAELTRDDYDATLSAIEAAVNGVDSRATATAGALTIAETRIAAIEAPTAAWGDPTGTATRAAFATGTVTLPQLAERLHALIDDLKAKGIIG